MNMSERKLKKVELPAERYGISNKLYFLFGTRLKTVPGSGVNLNVAKFYTNLCVILFETIESPR